MNEFSERVLHHLGMLYRTDPERQGLGRKLRIGDLLAVLEDEGVDSLADYEGLPKDSRRFIDDLLVVFYRRFLPESVPRYGESGFCLRFSVNALDENGLFERAANVATLYSPRSLFTTTKTLSFRGIDDEHGHIPTFRYYSDNRYLMSKLLEMKPLLEGGFAVLVPETVEDVFEREDAPTEGGITQVESFIPTMVPPWRQPVEIGQAVIPEIRVPEIVLPFGNLASIRRDHAESFGRFHKALLGFYAKLSTAESDGNMLLAFEEIASKVRDLDTLNRPGFPGGFVT